MQGETGVGTETGVGMEAEVGAETKVGVETAELNHFQVRNIIN